MRADRELATDALALAQMRESNREPYGETILKVLEGFTGERALRELVGIVENKARLKERLAAIGRPRKHWKWAAPAVTVLIASIGLTGAQTDRGGASNAARAMQPDSAGVTGLWQAKDVAFAPWVFQLKAEGGKVTGTVKQGQTSGNVMTTLTGETPIYDGVIAGNSFSFKCDVAGGGRTISFSGVLAGNAITFTRSVKVQPGAPPGMNGIYGASGATNFTAKRVVTPAATGK